MAGYNNYSKEVLADRYLEQYKRDKDSGLPGLGDTMFIPTQSEIEAKYKEVKAKMPEPLRAKLAAMLGIKDDRETNGVTYMTPGKYLKPGDTGVITNVRKRLMSKDTFTNKETGDKETKEVYNFFYDIKLDNDRLLNRIEQYKIKGEYKSSASSVYDIIMENKDIIIDKFTVKNSDGEDKPPEFETNSRWGENYQDKEFHQTILIYKNDSWNDWLIDIYYDKEHNFVFYKTKRNNSVEDNIECLAVFKKFLDLIKSHGAKPENAEDNTLLGFDDNQEPEMTETNFDERKYFSDNTKLAKLTTPTDIKFKQFKAKPLELKRTKHLFGALLNDANLFIYGTQGSGKSHFALILADDLALNGKVLYVMAEEKIDTRIKERLRRTKVDTRNIEILPSKDFAAIADYITNGKYKFVIIDSKDELIISKTVTEMDLYDLAERFPDICFVFITRMDKAGKLFTGKSAFAFIVDTEIKIEDGIAQTIKHRDGVAGKRIAVFPDRQWKVSMNYR